LDPDPSSLSSSVSVVQSFLEFAPGPGLLVVTIIVLAFSLFASALFAGSDIALFGSASRNRSEHERSSARLRRRLAALRGDGQTILVTVALVNTLLTILVAVLGALVAGSIARGTGAAPEIVLAAEVIVITIILGSLGILAPRILAERRPELFLRAASLPVSATHTVLNPASHFMARSSDSIRDRIRGSAVKRSTDDLKSIAELGEEHGTLEDTERELIHSIVEFGTMTVREVMVSRLDIVALPMTANVQEAIEIIRESGHSRLPLYVEHLDNIAGIVYAKDLLPYLGNGDRKHIDWSRLARSPMFVPTSKKLDDLLRDFQSKKTHIAIVVDEYGGTAGLVTLEDLLEEIVGDIRDEHDEGEAPMIESMGNDVYRVDARVNLDDLNEELGTAIDTDEFDFETLGGLVFHVTGAIPEDGEEVEFENLRMRVEGVENHRIGFITVKITNEANDSR
jgi:putative hemolysin